MNGYKLNQRIKKEVESYASNCIYRINASNADCYAFSLYKNKKGRLDFEGGWDWSDKLIDKDAEYLYIFKSREFVKR